MGLTQPPDYAVKKAVNASRFVFQKHHFSVLIDQSLKKKSISGEKGFCRNETASSLRGPKGHLRAAF